VREAFAIAHAYQGEADAAERAGILNRAAALVRSARPRSPR
jgi:hypothetical protein